MAKALSEDAIAQFRRDGFYSPYPLLPKSEALGLRARLEAVEAAEGGALKPAQRNKSHLLFKWLDDLIRGVRECRSNFERRSNQTYFSSGGTSGNSPPQHASSPAAVVDANSNEMAYPERSPKRSGSRGMMRSSSSPKHLPSSSPSHRGKGSASDSKGTSAFQSHTQGLNMNAKHRFAETEIRKVFFQMLDALAYLNMLGVVHRDVKAENILWVRTNVDDVKCEFTGGDYKLCDFGIAANAAQHAQTSSGGDAGTSDSRANASGVVH